MLSNELKGPLRATMNDTRNRSSEEFVFSAGERELRVAAKLRGNSRVRACRFRPLHLDFSAPDTTNSLFEGQGKLKLVTQCRKSDAYYFVPYDFGQSGLVYARDAKPAPEVNAQSVRTRRYRGFCIDSMHEAVGTAAIEARKQDLLELVAGLPDAKPKVLESRMGYLQEYFDASRDPGQLAADFKSRCL